MNGVNNVRSDVNRAIWRIFRDNGVKIPVAQRELRMLDRPPPRQLGGQPPTAQDDRDNED